MNVYAGGKDISNYIESISWSGDENQLARKMTVSYLYAPKDYTKQSIALNNGDRITMTENGKKYFEGIVIEESTQENSSKADGVSYDYSWYLRNKVLGAYQGTPGSVARAVCSDNGIPAGNIYDPGGEVEIISTGELSISKIIQNAYEGLDAHIYMDGTSLCIERYGEKLAGTVTGDDYVTDASYKSSIENMVNRVLLLDASEQPAGEISNGLGQFGIIQETYKISGDEVNQRKEAEKLLKGIESSGKITVKGNPEFQTGRAIIVEKVNSRIRGRFIIISDSHSIADASYITTLGLRFETVV